MEIKLKGKLPERLRDLMLKPGDKFNAEPSPVAAKKGAVRFKHEIDDEFHIVTVWPRNYEKL